MIQQPGIFLEMPSAEYFADPAPVPSLTQSIAKVLIERSPAHARLEHPRLAPPQEDEEPEKYVAAQAIGNAAHLLMIGRGKTLAIAEFDDWRKKDAQTFRADAEEIGKVAILEKHFAHAVEMEGAARRQLIALGWSDAFTQGQGEVVIAWQEGETWFRSMIDWMPSTTILYDLKTSAASLAPHLIAPKMEGDGWHVQAAMHERGLDVLDPGSRRAPQVPLHRAGEQAALRAARRRARRALADARPQEAGIRGRHVARLHGERRLARVPA
jgi:hypothetical protein